LKNYILKLWLLKPIVKKLKLISQKINLNVKKT